MPDYLTLTYWHLATILPAFVLGTYLLLNRKGTPRHRLLGKIYLSLMLASALITALMPAQVGPTLLNHFGFLHLLIPLVLFGVWGGVRTARQRRIAWHRAIMLSLYFGALIIAGGFALGPGRLLHSWIFGS